jgi:hypothetical protein
LLETLGAYPRRKHLKGNPIGLTLAMSSNSMTSLERVSKDKCSSLLGLFDSNKGKSLITLTPGVNVIKLFSFVTDDEARVFVLGKTQMERLSDASSLGRLLVLPTNVRLD